MPPPAKPERMGAWMTDRSVDGVAGASDRPRRRFWPRFNIALVLPAQLTMVVVVIGPTLIILWLVRAAVVLTLWAMTEEANRP